MFRARSVANLRRLHSMQVILRSTRFNYLVTVIVDILATATRLVSDTFACVLRFPRRCDFGTR